MNMGNDDLRKVIESRKFLFFGGKGGVGKTTMAATTATWLSDHGYKTLIVATDPTVSLSAIYGQDISATEVTKIGIERNLCGLNINPKKAMGVFQTRLEGMMEGFSSMFGSELLSTPCTEEIAAFDQFVSYFEDTEHDKVVFDTAPTGHTIRLLQLPGNWTEFLDHGKGDASCLGPLAGLDKQKAMYAGAVEALSDPGRTRLVLVARANRAALAEIARTHSELAAIGMTRQHVVVNGVLPDPADDTDPLATAVYQREQAALAGRGAAIVALPTDLVELKPVNMVGLDALSTLFDTTTTTTAVSVDDTEPGVAAVADASLADLVDAIEADGHGLVMCMGKGGVGKTTIAAAIAVALARRGHDVHLTTTDPAAHLTDTLAGELDHLVVSRIDPHEASETYRDRVLATKGAGLDEAGRATLAEDLLSPCTEEVAVFQAFSKVIHESRRKFVVVDTAPTGHTLLLLDATGSYHREIARQMGDGGRFITPLMRLQDPAQTKIVLVTLAETTPVLEAAGLQDDLRRAGIEPWGWVVNNSLAAAAPTAPLLRQRAVAELEQIDTVRDELANRCAVIPLAVSEPVGITALGQLAERHPAPVR